MPDSGEYRNSNRLDMALEHLKMGFAAFSVWSTTPDGVCKCPKKADCESAGKHPIPANGFLAATTDPKRLTAMMSVSSEPNYGLVWPDGGDVVVILDVDGHHWKDVVKDLKAEYGLLPKTKTTHTPSGGLHLFYRWPTGVPVPDTNHLHGFVARFPNKGYVVGVGSAINGKVYTDAGIEDMAVLPLDWAQPPARASRVSITVTGEEGGYELPTSIPTGGRHDAIAAFVASRWNRGITKAEIAASVRSVLVPLFDELMDDHRLSSEIEHAWDTAAKKWHTPGQTESSTAEAVGASGEVIEIDLLAIESRIDKPTAMDPHAMPLPTGLAMLIDHFRPLTDAPWSSLLLASSVVMSALAGPTPTLNWRGRHGCALFGCLVGHSGYGRKGAAMRETERAFLQVDPLLPDIQTGGLASGEVLVDILNESKTNTLSSSLIWEHEIANVLVLASREGNIMSGNLRKAWDGDRVESRSRAKGKSQASGYHVAFMGGVTPSELEKRLTANDIANGWANRFLWFHAEKRPESYDPTRDATMPAPLVTYLRDCIAFARTLGGSMLIKPLFTMKLSDAALARMEAMALALDVPPVGTIGALQQRMPLHTIRLAMVAAIFDQSPVVELDHVLFGEAMTSYAVDSMRSVFGIRVDDPVAMFILSVLMQVPDGWMNTTDLKKVTGKDYPRVQSALRVLLAEGLVAREERPTRGRPAIGYRMRSVKSGLSGA